MAKTTAKGEIGEAMVIADLIRPGHDVAIPFGHKRFYHLRHRRSSSVVEHSPRKRKARGSIPLSGSRKAPEQP